MKFAYQEFEVEPSSTTSRKKILLRPIIPVIILKDKRFVGYQALVDSGSDYNIFEAGVAQLLKIKLSTGHKRQMSGISGEKVKGYEHIVRLKIAGKEFKEKIIFSNQIPENSFGVLGNEGFFNHFKVDFDYKNKITEIKWV